MRENEVVGGLDLEWCAGIGTVAVAIFPSGSPVLKKKDVSAAAGTAESKPITATEIGMFRVS